MTVETMPDEPDPERHLAADDARQGEIVLRKRWQRLLFLIGLAATVFAAIILPLVCAH